MNKQIQELAKVAGFRSDVTVSDRHDNYIVTTTGERLEKFAELIVRECIDIIDEEGSHEGGSIRSMEKIREHFGVEENNQYSDIISDGGMDPRNPPTNYDTYNDGVIAERNRIINLFMIMHESAKGSHNYWHVAANLVQADIASDT